MASEIILFFKIDVALIGMASSSLSFSEIDASVFGMAAGLDFKEKSDAFFKRNELYFWNLATKNIFKENLDVKKMNFIYKKHRHYFKYIASDAHPYIHGIDIFIF